ncbi:CD47 protein, partial [Glareola pratincola]|nr:CD47 protein [Glareola pratincola]
GSAQLVFNVTDVVQKTDCNKTVILPCHVINLNENNPNVMFVTWKRQGNIIFSFDGGKKEFFRDSTVPSANLVSQEDLPKGIASLRLNSEEADVGNYSCEVTESNREGETRVELRQYSGSWFLLLERAVIIALLFLIIFFCLAQIILVALKYDIGRKKKIALIVTTVFSIVFAILGTLLFVQDGYTARNQAGLGLIVVPAVIFILSQYLVFRIGDLKQQQATFSLIGLQILGYVIAVVGFALCVS